MPASGTRRSLDEQIIEFRRQRFIAMPIAGTMVWFVIGLMWLPVSWLLHHWVGIAHGTVRTMLILLTWYLFPELRFVAIPMLIVTLYVATIAVLEYRWRSIQDHKSVIGKV